MKGCEMCIEQSTGWTGGGFRMEDDTGYTSSGMEAFDASGYHEDVSNRGD